FSRDPSVLFFFFSSRRRHTRFSRDWSSDVCSSDLGPAGGGGLDRRGPAGPQPAVPGGHQRFSGGGRRRLRDVRGSAPLLRFAAEIGRASCRERGEIPVSVRGGEKHSGGTAVCGSTG